MTLALGVAVAFALVNAGDARATRQEATVRVSAATAPTPQWTGLIGLNAYLTNDLARIAAGGVRRVRMDTPSAATIRRASHLGITVLPVADYEPWPDLNGGRGDKYPPFPRYYKKWSDRMLARWSHSGSPPEAIEVWNEPWLTTFWRPVPDPAAYYRLFAVFAAEAWRIWPNVKLLISADTVGSVNTTGTNVWRRYLLGADKSGLLKDPRVAPTTHNYVQDRAPAAVTPRPCLWDLDRFKCAYHDFKAHGNPNPRVWVTEYGWESDVVGEANQAAYMTQALSIFHDSGIVEAAFAFLLRTGDPWSYNWLRADGSSKPVVGAVQSLIAS